MQDALKEIFGPMFEAMLNGEMEHHLGYAPSSRAEKEHANRRNGYSQKTIKTTAGPVDIKVPKNREASFAPQIIKKRQTDVSSIEGKVLTMYARSMSQRDVASTIEDIYGFKLSHEQISTITDCVLEELREWQARVPLFVPPVFSIRGESFCGKRLETVALQTGHVLTPVSGGLPIS